MPGFNVTWHIEGGTDFEIQREFSDLTNNKEFRR